MTQQEIHEWLEQAIKEMDTRWMPSMTPFYPIDKIEIERITR